MVLVHKLVIFQNTWTTVSWYATLQENVFKNDKAFIITVAAYVLLGPVTHVFASDILVRDWSAMLPTVNIVALLLCLLLYVKGRISPSTSDCAITSNPVTAPFQ